MRTRMYGGVTGKAGDRLPMSIEGSRFRFQGQFPVDEIRGPRQLRAADLKCGGLRYFLSRTRPFARTYKTDPRHTSRVGKAPPAKVQFQRTGIGPILGK